LTSTHTYGIVVFVGEAHTNPRRGAMLADRCFTVSYEEACKHAEDNYRSTGGAIVGGGYMVRMHDGRVMEIELRVTKSGIARPVWD